MATKNTNLQCAKNARDDEFFTTYEDIEREVAHYARHFCGKVVLCNCDEPYKSNFCRYFRNNFSALKLKRLICSSFAKGNGRGRILDFDGGRNCRARRLHCDGDFRSEECLEYLRVADIVVTNPPFSLFKEFVGLLTNYKKKYLIVGNQNALTYKEIFPLIQRGEAWTGHQFGEMKFRVPADSEPRSIRYWVDDSGQKWRSLGNAMWLTNLDIERRHEKLTLTKKYNQKEHPKYDAYDAIDVHRITDIPYDFSGIMGVPITILNRYNADQFEIVGEANHGSDNEYDLFRPTIGGKWLFKRILIRNKKVSASPTIRFRILDLFSGAGGFSYGMEKNPHFRTEIATDFNAKAMETFRRNIPHAITVVGDITREEVKNTLIKLSVQQNVNMIIGGPPCQGFSLKGKKLGLDDPRNFLFNEYLKLVEAIRPEVFVLENVKALLSTSAGWFKNQILEKVKSLGYHAEYGVLTASDFGVPQSRQRAIFICTRQGHIPLPTVTRQSLVTVRDAISDLAYLNSGDGEFEQSYAMPPTSDYQRMMRENSVRLFNHKASRHSEVAVNKLKMIPPECGKEFLPAGMKGRQKFSGTWGRLKWDSVSPTIDTRFDAASNGTNNHPFLNRAITPREAARLQSFDDAFVFVGSKVYVRQQIGNAVPPLMALAIANQIYVCVVN